MRLRQKIKDVLFRSGFGEQVFFGIRRIREKTALAFIKDEQYIKRTYKKRFKRKINLKNPTTYTEKLQWLKLFYRNEKMPVCSDKYDIRKYLEECQLEYLANDIVGIYENVEDVDFEALPDKFAAKATHGSSWNLICEDKSTLDISRAKRKMKAWLKLNLYVFGREWNYKTIKPRIIIEKFIEHKPLNDYKFMCFNGEPMYMQLNNDYEGIHYVDFYELDGWKHLPFTYGPYKRSDRTLEKPQMYDEMMRLARILSKPFPFVRVDFYNFGDTIILGELTYFPGGGLWPLIPNSEYDAILGEKLTLPEPNYNLELYKKWGGVILLPHNNRYIICIISYTFFTDKEVVL